MIHFLLRNGTGVPIASQGSPAPTGWRIGRPAAAATPSCSITAVKVKAIGATADLGGVPSAGHGAITRSCRSAAIGDGITAVLRTQREWKSAKKLRG
jgi:hypothetical protein